MPSGECTVLRTGQPVETQDVFFWRLAGRSAPTGLAYCPLDRVLTYKNLIKRPVRDACLCMGELQAPPAPHFVFLITL